MTVLAAEVEVAKVGVAVMTAYVVKIRVGPGEKRVYVLVVV